ncbi:uncharacterized protein AMSG_10645 [Thecamonas trahens ATCC 50062]|uniref:Uncharacterized protein n=1 Tax=Thecamonas trahens ATCC 50062 TaxID=461836 RepID=A0A0L0DRU2_THETB|nr:hypothetical protein AMSG_10645 [Thecamonas trahens ATCC 50062]KNC55049.1 hypothetical protein AMSG_10645 [Thecamonas trahens ATCC 50062]|eukprot:XP_013753353.1 hypothetical protein AMSG_10645 [Thecamonas trahens ATCC 50062]
MAAIGLYYNTEKTTYRLIGYYASDDGSQKVVLNSYVTHDMALKKASPKFVQWSSSANRKLCGLTFGSPEEADAFIAQIQKAIAHLKQVAAAAGIASPTAAASSPTPVAAASPTAGAAGTAAAGTPPTATQVAAQEEAARQAAAEQEKANALRAKEAKRSALRESIAAAQAQAKAQAEAQAAAQAQAKAEAEAQVAAAQQAHALALAHGGKPGKPAKPGKPGKPTPGGKPGAAPVAAAAAVLKKGPTLSRTEWQKCEVPKRGVALCDFTPAGNHEVALVVGQAVLVVEEIFAWQRGVVLATGAIGIWPSNRVHIHETRPDDQPILDELVAQMEEIKELAVDHYKAGQMPLFNNLCAQFHTLREARSRILAFSARGSIDKVTKAKRAAVATVNESRTSLNMNTLALTNNGIMADDTNTGLVKLYWSYAGLTPEASVELAKVSAEAQTTRAAGGDDDEEDASGLVQLLVGWKSFVCPLGNNSAGEEAHLHFSVIAKGPDESSPYETITDEFQLRLTHQGMPFNVDDIGNIRFAFSDLNEEDLARELYLVCRVVRKGKMQADDSKQRTTKQFRRLFGIAMLPLDFKSLATKRSAEEHMFSIYQTPAKPNMDPDLLTHMLFGTGIAQVVPQSVGVAVELQILNGAYTPESYAAKGYANVSLISKLSFPDVILPGESRNDLYVTLHGAELSKDLRNCMVVVNVVNPDGRNVDGCLTINGKPESLSTFESCVCYHETKPRWAEKFCLNIEPSLAKVAHLRFSLVQCTTSDNTDKEVGFAFLPLTTADGAFVANEVFSLNVYKPPKDAGKLSPTYYLTETDPKKLVPRKQETITVSIQLTSTLLTQNTSLNSLLMWHTISHDERKLSEILDRFLYLSKGEIVLFFQDIYDVLFELLEKKPGVSKAVYDALVFIIGIMTEDRAAGAEFRKVIDVYIEQHYRGVMAHQYLIASLKQYVDSPKQFRKQVQASIKAVEYIFRLIIRSRLLYNDAYQTTSREPQFVNSMSELLSSFNALMEMDDRVLLGIQTLALRKFSTLFIELTRMFEYGEVAAFVAQFLGAVKTDNASKLYTEKIKFIRSLARSELVVHPGSRETILPLITTEMLALLEPVAGEERKYDDESFDPRVAAIGAIGSICDQVGTLDDEQRRVLMSELMIFFRPLTDALSSLLQEDSIGFTSSQLVTSGMALYKLLKVENLLEYYASLGSVTAKLHLLQTIVTFVTQFAEKQVYPAQWLTFNVIKADICLAIAGLIMDLVVADATPDSGLLPAYFSLLARVVTSPAIQVEHLGAATRKRVLCRWGDLRARGASMLVELWTKLGDARVGALIPSIIGDLLAVMMLSCEAATASAVDILCWVFKWEYASAKSLLRVEVEIFDRYDAERADEEFGSRFLGALDAYIASLTDEGFKTKMEETKSNLGRLVALTLELQQLPDDPLFDQDRIAAILELTSYLLSIGRLEAYVRQVLHLVELHEAGGTFAEAGYALLMYADKLEWSPEIVPYLSPAFPEQTMYERKRAVLQKAAVNLDKGKVYEEAVRVYSTLAAELEGAMAYAEAAAALQAKAAILSKVATEERFETAYYRIGYFGRSFAPSIRNKEFILRGKPLEQIRNLPPNKAERSEYFEQDGLFIQIAKVDPVVDPATVPAAPYPGIEMPKAQAEYFKQAYVRTFRSSRPWKKPGVVKDKSNEFATLWQIRTTVSIDGSFPGVLTRAVVVDRNDEEVSPLDGAVESLVDKNAEVAAMIDTYAAAGASLNLSPLTMALNGIILAFVNGGTSMFSDYFITKNYIAENPQDKDKVEQLRDQIRLQSDIVGRGLGVHEKLVSAEMRALHDTLVTSFHENREGLEAQLAYT